MLIDESMQDPRFPILLQSATSETIRLAPAVEKRLRAATEFGGCPMNAIRTKGRYLEAVSYAAESEEELEQGEQAAKKLLKAVFGEDW